MCEIQYFNELENLQNIGNVQFSVISISFSVFFWKFDIYVQTQFSQNKNLREHLLSTKDAILAEASPSDRKWGIGLPANNPLALCPDNWRGQNLLGQVLMEVRDELSQMDSSCFSEETTEVRNLEKFVCTSYVTENCWNIGTRLIVLLQRSN